MKSCTTYNSSKGHIFISFLLKKNQVIGEFICWQLIFHLKKICHHLHFILILGSLTRVASLLGYKFGLSFVPLPPCYYCGGSMVGFVFPSASQICHCLILLSGLLWIEPIKSLTSLNVMWVQDILIQSCLFTWPELNLGNIGNFEELCLAVSSVNMVWRVKGERKGEKRTKMRGRSRDIADRGGKEGEKEKDGEERWGVRGQVGRERERFSWFILLKRQRNLFSSETSSSGSMRAPRIWLFSFLLYDEVKMVATAFRATCFLSSKRKEIQISHSSPMSQAN